MKLMQQYQTKIQPELGKELKVKNTFAIPKLTKVVINIGLGEAINDKNLVEKAAAEMTAITGQKAKITRARKAVATFKLRAGVPIGVQVTLRRQKMYDFAQKLCTIVLPRLRDFKGISRNGFDGRGNYSMGLEEQIVFPEIDYGKIERVRGLQITFVTTAKTDEHALALLEKLGLPFTQKH